MSEKFEIKMRKISELIPSEYNPRKISEKQFNELKKSFQSLGTLEPAVINMHPERKNIIISGHQRINVAADLGMDEYPCHEVSFSLKKEKQANIRMNKNGGDWNFDALSAHFEGLELLAWGFEEKDLLESFTPNVLPDFDGTPTPEPDKPKPDEDPKEDVKKDEDPEKTKVLEVEHVCPQCSHKWVEKVNG